MYLEEINEFFLSLIRLNRVRTFWNMVVSSSSIFTFKVKLLFQLQLVHQDDTHLQLSCWIKLYM